MTDVAEPVTTNIDLMPSADRYKRLVARSVRMLNHASVMHMSGHLAVRDADEPSRVWINSRKASRSTITAADIVPVDLGTGKRIGTGDEPPSEFPIHHAIFRRRADVGAIVHTHTEHIIALSIVGIPLMPVHLPAGFLPERAPVFDDPNLMDTLARGELLADALGDAPVVVLRGHGVVVVGRTVEEAVARTVLAEENARLQCIATGLGKTPRTLAGEELRLAAKQMTLPIVMTKHYHYHEETARSAGALDGVDG
jgi:ribulose-5-phosphate 4-epimerase/fuculose-1-phosphate aldolase